jgi:signal transduction histidine kinase/CheY-like chemotaxis protein
VLLLGLAATLLVTWRLAETIHDKDESRFVYSVAAAQDAIADRLDTYMSLLRGGAALFAASGEVSRDEFRTYVHRQNVEQAYPGIQGIGFSRRVPAGELTEFVEAARAEGKPDFRVWPEDQREEYHSIVYLEPLDRRNRAAIGFDMFTEPTRRAAMERARDTGLPQATGKVTLVQEIDENKQAGFLIYMPVYGGEPATLDERRESLLGFVYSPFRADDLLAGVFAQKARPRLHFAVFDGAPSPESQLHNSGPEPEGRFRTTDTLPVAGRQWTIEYRTLPEFELVSGRAFLPIALSMGMLLSIAFSAFTWSEGKARGAAESSAAALDASRREIERLNADLEVRLGEVETLAAQREQLLQSEREARTAAEHAGRMKDEFLATLSHELRTPLNAILGYSQLLGMASLDEAEREDARDAIERNAWLQSKLIEDLLDMNRIVSGKIRLDLRPIDPADALDEAIEAATPAARNKGVALIQEFEHGGAKIMADHVRLQQIVWNLLSNAVKFTPAGGAVRVSLARGESDVTISVADTGQGISAHFLPHVFDRFRQADGSSTRRHGGLGLGLSIVWNLVELHGGRVTAESEGEGRGATFRVRLPTHGAAHIEEAPAMPASTATSDEAKGALAGIRVLVVDDEPDANALLKRLLEQRQAQVAVATSPAEAWPLLTENQFDVLLSDISMPQEDGYQFIRRIRTSNQPFSHIRAAAVTAFARPEDKARAKDAGFDDHLAKPIEAKALMRLVKRLALAD